MEIDPAATAWLLACTALVLLMTPGLAIFYGGMVRSTGVLNMIMMCFISIPVVTIVWLLAGYTLAFGQDAGGGLIGNLDHVGLLGIDPTTVRLNVPEPPDLPTGFRDRHGRTGLRRDRRPRQVLGVDDLHRGMDRCDLCSRRPLGLGARRLARVVGHGRLRGRAGRRDRIRFVRTRVGAGARPPNRFQVRGERRDNLPFVLLGVGLLWFGWFGFNAGSALAADGKASVVFLNTLIAGCLGMLGWIFVERVRDGRPTTFGAASGVVAGLVAITPSCGFVAPIGAFVVGLAAGVVCSYAVGWKFKAGYDDSLDVVGVHFVGGVVGTFLIGLVAAAVVSGGVEGLFYGGGLSLLGKQTLAIPVVAVFAFVVSFIIAKIIDSTFGFRVQPEDEISGIDPLSTRRPPTPRACTARRRSDPGSAD